MAGEHGRELERLSDAEVMAVALEAMVEAFGAGIRKRVVKTLRTHWASDPFTLGGYSHARPGRAASRLMFAEPVGDRIVLAGEHCSIPFYSTVHGAHLSGIAAAEKAAESAHISCHPSESRHPAWTPPRGKKAGSRLSPG